MSVFFLVGGGRLFYQVDWWATGSQGVAPGRENPCGGVFRQRGAGFILVGIRINHPVRLPKSLSPQAEVLEVNSSRVLVAGRVLFMG